MNSRHSVEIKQLLHKKKLSRSRFNPDSRLKLQETPIKSRKQLKRSQSSASLSQGDNELQSIQRRFEKLHHEYLKTVQETKKRQEMCQRQEAEIEKYERAHERDVKQIQRLKTMVGFVEKRDFGTQTEGDSGGRFTGMRKIQEPQQHQQQQSGQKVRVRGDSPFEKRFPLESKSELMNKISGVKEPQQQERNSAGKGFYKKVNGNGNTLHESRLNHSSTHLKKVPYTSTVDLLRSYKNLRSPEKQTITKSRVRSPNNRYRFVPSVELG